MMTVRRASLMDASGIARVSVETWRATYRGMMPDVILDNLPVAERTEFIRDRLNEGASQRMTFVAEDETGQIIGFAACGPARTPDPPPTPPVHGGRDGSSTPPAGGGRGSGPAPRVDGGMGSGSAPPAGGGMGGYTGAIYALYVLPAYQGQGIGRDLVAAVVHFLRAQGHAVMLVRVLAANPARGFYERLGGVAVGETEIVIRDTPLTEVGYGFTFDTTRL